MIREDLINRAKVFFISNVMKMMKDRDLYVPDHVQQLEKLLIYLQ